MDKNFIPLSLYFYPNYVKLLLKIAEQIVYEHVISEITQIWDRTLIKLQEKIQDRRVLEPSSSHIFIQLTTESLQLSLILA